MAIVWFIDDMPDEARIYSRKLQLMLGSELEVRPLEPEPSQDAYVQLLQDPNTVCLIVDQRLFVRGTVTYTGISLAQYLRGINTKVPIYILTNWSNDTDAFAGGEWSIEAIISKEDLIRDERDEQRKTHGARIRRNINIYQDILLGRAARFNTLLHKSLKEDLSEEEVNELDQLQAARASAIVAEELQQLRSLEDIIKQANSLLKEFGSDPNTVQGNNET